MKIFDLTGKTAVVTGSSRGIGRAIAEQMALFGANVVVSSRKAEPCEEVVASIKKAGGKAVAIPAHIGDKAALQGLVDKARQTSGKIDVLVCNAASNPYYGPLAGISDEQFRKILDNNIVANNWLTSMVVPQMIERKDGSVSIVSSIGGIRGTPEPGAYGISKARDFALARRIEDVVLWKPAFFGVKPDLVIKGGSIVAAPMGDPNASIPTPQPVHYRYMFGAFGKARTASSLVFVSQAAVANGLRKKLGVEKQFVALEHTRNIGKKDMIHNDAMPQIDVDPDTYEAVAEGE